MPPENPLEPISSRLESEGIRLRPEQREKIVRYVDLLEHWNRRINLTGARTRKSLLEKQILDCLMLEKAPRGDGLRSWLDIGSGAGMPGLLLAILHPEIHVTALDTVAKKTTFLSLAARELGLGNVTVLRENVHRLRGSRNGEIRFDAAVARAFARLEVLLELGPRLLRPGGEMWAMKGPRWREELELLEGAPPAPYERRFHTHPYRLAERGAESAVLVFRLRKREPWKPRDNG